jgi:hypothetical protein
MWTYRGKKIQSHDDLHSDCTDIVYVINYFDDFYYIGKKAVRAKRKYPPLKGKVRPRRLMKNLPFVDYEGSIETDLRIASKMIIYQCNSRKTSTYLEAKLLFRNDILGDHKSLNDNILGKFFKKDTFGVLLL